MTKYTGINFKTVIIGSGNLATHLSLAIHSAGHDIIQIFSRHADAAKALADRVGADFTDSLDQISPDGDIYIYAVTDNALHEVIRNISESGGLHVHTSGSGDIELFNGIRTSYGSLYPLQTFTKYKKVDFTEIPIFYETNSEENDKLLYEFCKTLSDKIYRLNSEERRYVHLAAVFACNFSNMMWNISSDILESRGIPFEFLLPLVSETLNKTRLFGPFLSQTGPALRNDSIVINEHIAMLEQCPDLQNIYKEITELIIKQHNKK